MRSKSTNKVQKPINQAIQSNQMKINENLTMEQENNQMPEQTLAPPIDKRY